MILTACVAGQSLGWETGHSSRAVPAQRHRLSVSRREQSLSLLSIKVPPWSDSQELRACSGTSASTGQLSTAQSCICSSSFEPRCWPRSTTIHKEPYPWDVTLAWAGVGDEGMLCRPRQVTG